MHLSIQTSWKDVLIVPLFDLVNTDKRGRVNQIRKESFYNIWHNIYGSLSTNSCSCLGDVQSEIESF